MTTIIVKEQNTGWFFAAEPEAVAIAKGIGLPLLTLDDGRQLVCLPLNLRDHYEERARKANITLRWVASPVP